MKLYHASNINNIDVLMPFASATDEKQAVCFSSKRENVLVYLSNAVEKFFKDQNKFSKNEKYAKWATYGFKNGLLNIEEYYPNALKETYGGVAGYIYSVEANNLEKSKFLDVYISDKPVKVLKKETIEDIYQEILKAEQAGLIYVTRYETMSEKKKESVKQMIQYQYENADKNYKKFLIAKFPYLKKMICLNKI